MTPDNNQTPSPPPQEPRHSRTTTSALYVATSYLSIVFVIIQGLVLVPLYLRYIDPVLYGAWLATGGALAYLALLDLGLTIVIRQQVSEAYGQRDRQRIGDVAGTGLVITLGLAGLITLAGALLAQWLPGWIGVSGQDAATLGTAILLASVSSGLTTVAYALSDVAVGLQRVVAINTLNLVAWSVGIIATVLMLTAGLGLLAIPAGFLIRTCLYLVALSVNLLLIWRRVGLDGLHVRRRQLHVLGGMISFTFMGRVADTMIDRTDEIIVAKLLGTGMVPTFTLTKRAKDVVATFPDRVSFAIVPTLAHLYGEQGMGKTRQRAVEIISIIVGITVASAAGILAMNQSFVTLWVGQQFYGGMLLTALICVQFVLVTIRLLFARLLMAIAVVDLPNRLLLLEAILRIPLAIVLTQMLGLIGIPLAGIVALLATQGVFLTRELGRRLQLGLRDFAGRWPALLLYPIAAVVLGLAWMLVLQAANWRQFLLQAGALAAILAALLWALNPDVRRVARQLLLRLWQRLRRRRSDPNAA